MMGCKIIVVWSGMEEVERALGGDGGGQNHTDLEWNFSAANVT
jgi:hypothetical protein